MIELCQKYSILTVQETWRFNFNEYVATKLKNRGKVAYFMTRANKKKVGRMKAGAAIIINENLKDKTQVNYINERIFVAKINLNPGQRYVLINVYMPSNGDPVEFDLVLQQVSQVRRNNKRFGKIIILGDFNADVMRQNHIDKIFTKWLENENQTSVVNLFRQVASNTFLNERGFYSWIDHILIDTSEPWSELINCRIHLERDEHQALINDHANHVEITRKNWPNRNVGDHRPVELTLDTTTNIERSTESSFIKGRIDWLNSSHIQEYGNLVRDESEKLKLDDFTRALNGSDPTGAAQDLITAIEKIATNSKERLELLLTTTRTKSGDQHYSRSNAWWNDELNILHDRRRFLRDQWLLYRTENFRTALAFTRTEIKRVQRARVKKASNDKMEKLMSIYNRKRLIGFWIKYKKLRAKTAMIDIDQEELTKHYESVFNTPNSSEKNADFDAKVDTEVTSKIQEVMERPEGSLKIDVEEIVKILKNMPNGKAPGFSGIRNEMLKHAIVTPLVEAIARLLECLINRRVMANNMNIGVIITIPKD